jgi:hypothetical protein
VPLFSSDGCDDFSQLWKMSLLAAILPGFTIVFNYLFIPKLPYAPPPLLYSLISHHPLIVGSSTTFNASLLD